jgi:hypothetical protein
MICSFEMTYVVNLATGTVEETHQNKFMQIEGKKTSEQTLRMDGSVRATNSRNWTFVGNPNVTDQSTLHFSGDDGELLTILIKEKDQQGNARATLASSWGVYAITSTGSCMFFAGKD